MPVFLLVFVGQSLADEPAAAQQKAFARIVTSADIKTQADIQQRSAKAVVTGAATQPKQMDVATSGVQIEAEMQRQARSNRAVVEATSSQVVEKIKEGLPKINELGLNLRLGDATTVSPDGKAVVAEIRRLAKASGATEQAAIVPRIAAFASKGVPEAEHFLGFLQETGMFNTRRSSSNAYRLYEQAASRGYAPAAYNMALMHAYGRIPSADSRRAVQLLGRAQAMAKDTSGRVCGMYSFLAYRSADLGQALSAAQECSSPLANLARASDARQPMQQRVNWLRDSLAAGVDDGFDAIVKISRSGAKNDPSATFCKYVLVARYFYKPPTQSLQPEATQCIEFVSKEHGDPSGPLSLKSQLVAGVAGFVPAEISELKRIRQGSRFHYSWPVPYLPFTGQEVELFDASYTAQGYK